MKTARILLFFCVSLAATDAIVAWRAAAEEPAKKNKSQPAQYRHDDIFIPAASADEAVRKTFSFDRATAYLEQGATAWRKERKCISCHTNAIYMIIRPALTARLGKPDDAMRTFYIAQLEELEAEDQAKQQAIKNNKKPKPQPKLRPTQVAFLAAGLASWDAHVTKQLSPETDRALRLMFRHQSDDGSWSNEDCWPPLESSNFHGATVAAIAAAEAPNWLKNIEQNAADHSELVAGIQKMKSFLRDSKPPHDYARLLLLQTSKHYLDMLSAEKRNEIIEMIFKHQREDGGWSLRTFAAPEAWGSGNREKRLRSETNFAEPASDGHQTGLAIMVLRDAGIAADDPRIARGVQWLKTNQRESGRWWTRSLNSDNYHFITYSGTAYPLLALDKCDAIEQPVSK